MKMQFKGINDIFKTQLLMFGTAVFYYCTDIFRQLIRMSENKFMTRNYVTTESLMMVIISGEFVAT